MGCRPPSSTQRAGAGGDPDGRPQAGKTTTVGSRRHLKEKKKKKVCGGVGRRTGRPRRAARTLAGQNGAVLPPTPAETRARRSPIAQVFHVLIVDTAGRLAIDEAMAEITLPRSPTRPRRCSNDARPADAPTPPGGDALATGVVLPRRNGAPSGSARYITGKPIKFVGTSEKSDGLTCPSRPRRQPHPDMGRCRWLAGSRPMRRRQPPRGRQGPEVRPQHMRDQPEQMQNMAHRPDGAAAGHGPDPRASRRCSRAGKCRG